MYRNVLVGVDEREGSRDAAVLARALAPHCERMSLINVCRQDDLGIGGAAPDDAAEHEFSLATLCAVRDEFALDAQLLSVMATSVSSGIKETAEEIGADLIVVGSCHRSAVGRVLGGNDATSTLHGAPCAVAIAPRGYSPAPGSITTVGVAYDGTPQSREALKAARRLADDVRAQITALDIEQIKIYGYGWAAPYVEGRDILTAGARQRLGELAGVDLAVVIGEPREELVTFSDRVDVLVCGSRERGPVKRVMLGSTSDHLVDHARSPLLVIPAVAGPAPARTRKGLVPTRS